MPVHDGYTPIDNLDGFPSDIVLAIYAKKFGSPSEDFTGGKVVTIHREDLDALEYCDLKIKVTDDTFSVTFVPIREEDPDDAGE